LSDDLGSLILGDLWHLNYLFELVSNMFGKKRYCRLSYRY
jgi:hypothetical protein